jgi:hypothetical protein
MTWRCKWPEEIPLSPSLASPVTQQPGTWRDDGSDGQEKFHSSMLKPILYRTPGGEKKRTTPLNLLLLGSIQGEPKSCVYGEEEKRRGYDLLQRAQTFIAARRAERQTAQSFMQQEGTQLTNRPHAEIVFSQTNMEDLGFLD